MVRIGFFDFVSALKLSGFSCLGRGLQQCRVWTTLKGFSLSDNKGMFSAWCRVTWGQASRSALSHYIPQTQLQVGIFPQNLAVTPISLVVRPCTRAQRIVKCKKKKRSWVCCKAECGQRVAGGRVEIKRHSMSLTSFSL